MAKGKPGNIPLGDGTTYNPVTQQYGGEVDNGNHYYGGIPGFQYPTPPKATATVPDPNEAIRAAAEANRRMNAIAAMQGVMSQYGLSSLMAKIEAWVVDGFGTDAILSLIRTTPEYDNRFPAMKALAAKNRAISESEYIAYETNAAQVETLYGLPKGMVTDKDQITKLLVGDISGRELESRAQKAAASVYSLPEEFRTAMRLGYGIDSGHLTGYFLDPDIAAPMLEKQFVSAQISGEAYLRGLDVGVPVSEMLYSLGVDRERARSGFGTVSGMLGFESGRGETATQDELVGAAFDTNRNDISKVVRIGQGRRGKFSEGGSFTGGNSGVSGVGSSSV